MSINNKACKSWLTIQDELNTVCTCDHGARERERENRSTETPCITHTHNIRSLEKYVSYWQFTRHETNENMTHTHSNRNETQLSIENAHTMNSYGWFSLATQLRGAILMIFLVQKCCQMSNPNRQLITKRGRVRIHSKTTWFISFGSHGWSQCNLSSVFC